MQAELKPTQKAKLTRLLTRYQEGLMTCEEYISARLAMLASFEEVK
jgi:hypothetical protein